jgi:two-component system OmpR family sensor kinase
MNLFFIFIFFVINILIIVQFLVDNKAKEALDENRYMKSIRIILEAKIASKNDDEINSLLQVLNLKISYINLDELSNNGKILTQNRSIKIFFYNREKYIQLIDKPFDGKPHFKDNFNLNHMPPPFFDSNPNFMPPFPSPQDLLKDLILIDELNEDNFRYFWCLVLFIIDVLLVWFLLFLRKKLKPLFILKEHMIKLSTGNFSISTKTNGKDEISQVANEFDNAIKQLKQLRESRNLFLRNIMHELKTPITKGKLVTDMYDECERKHILIRVFQRLEYLLSEFSKIEELTSGKINLQKDNYPAYDLIEQAFDILLLDNDKIDIFDNYNLFLNVDFELFSIALKNLIDNAISYNTNGNPEIFIEKDLIKIVNKGEKLTKDIEDYYKPFNHEYEDSSSGLGLGLYISNNIIKIHNFKLEYEYKDNHHNFVIKLN